jgi:hypothetical protein
MINGTIRTVQDVANRVKRQFGDESGTQITDNDIISWVNAAQLDIVTKNRMLKGFASTVSIAGQDAYTLDAVPILDFRGVRYAGYPLEPTNFNDVQELMRQTFIDNGIPVIDARPTLYYDWGNTLYLYPSPPNSGDVIDVFYVARPTDISNLLDTLKLPDTYFESICQFVLQKAYELDDDWTGVANTKSQLDESVTRLAADEIGVVRQAYPTITVLED